MTLPRSSARRTAVLAALGTAAAALVGTAPAATADPCPDVEVVFARGTSEPPGIGRVGQAMADTLAAQIAPRTVSSYGVNYPADYDFLTAADGAVDATNHIASMAAQCPSTKIVLGGYSQGAAVVDMLAGVPPLGNKIGSIGSAPPMSASTASNVAAVAVFGNPATKFGLPLTSSGLFAGRAIDLCKDGDPICSNGRNPLAHRGYEDAMAQQAAGFAAGRV
ncbi:cutinase [Mycolicibacterium agri]|uniref:Cutinase n=1 Tax=Mycolicibacterium agri TaxID=36811 RepID=A0A2A7MZ58_MYCAG|nr:cutinase family protein [Mycolicibacterium agri]PEG36611.1 cutinase [Mycolicibacterium agri]